MTLSQLLKKSKIPFNVRMRVTTYSWRNKMPLPTFFPVLSCDIQNQLVGLCFHRELMVKKRACRACNLHRGSGAADTAGVLPPFRNNSKPATTLVMPPLPQQNPTASAAPSRSLDLAVQVWPLTDSFCFL